MWLRKTNENTESDPGEVTKGELQLQELQG